MRRQTEGRLLTTAVVATTAALILFTLLQYRSSRQITEATGIRLADTLQMSLINWHVELERTFTSLTSAIDLQAGSDPAPDRIRAALAAWSSTTRYPTLVRRVVIQTPDGISAVILGEGVGATGVPMPATTGRQTSAGGGWVFHPSVPALARVLEGEPGPRWLVAVLDRTVLASSVLPDLALRYFSGTDGLDYDVALFTGAGRALYASSPEFGLAPATDRDGVLNIFGRRSSPESNGPYEVFLHVPLKPGGPSATVTWFPLPEGAPPAGDWRLVVRHRRGGALGAFLANAQRRDLLSTLGALALLVTSITLLVVASARAQRLAQSQMSFVTAVSHELRTPLTVIGSAADNIARGVVREAAHVAEYGTVIGQQSRQLGSLVERILLFASRARGTPAPPLARITVAGALDTTLARITNFSEGAAFTVERDIPPDLPAVMGDATALEQCLENLLNNAMKYSGTERWIGVRAYADRSAAGQVQVSVDVTDRGLGIPAAEQERIFEPFYRGAEAIAAQIHGTGLGLALARSLAEMMKGTITVTSTPGRGSTFTLRLPAAPPETA